MTNSVVQTRCHECGAMMIGQKGEHRYTESGLSHVILKDIMVYRCTKCTSVTPEIPEAGVLHRVIALRLISKKTRLNGEEIRFLRKLCGYSANEFAEILGASKSFISQIEKRGCGRQYDRTIRLLVITKLARELTGQSKPILKNVTPEQLYSEAEKALKEVQERSRPEQYEIFPEDIARFSAHAPEPETVMPAVN